MVKIGVFSDVHSNLPALEAVLDALEGRGCSRLICCGDIIGIGPHPEQTVRRIMNIPNLIAVAGNHDRYLSEGLPDSFPNAEQMDHEEMLHHRWEHALLSPESAAFIKSLPLRAELTVENHRICAVHYPMDEKGRYLPFNPARVCQAAEGDIFIHGHDHTRAIAGTDGQWIVNPGSLGCPGRDKNIARAAVLTVSEARVLIEPVDIPYDAAAVVTDVDRIDYPAAGNIKKFFYGIG